MHNVAIWRAGRATARKMWRQWWVFLLCWRLVTLPLLDFEMFLDSMLELSYRKIVVNQNFSDGSIKIGLEGTLRSFSNNCAWVIYGSAVLDRPLEMEMLRQTVFLIFNLTIPHFCSVILLVLSAWGGGTATSAAAVGHSEAVCVSCPALPKLCPLHQRLHRSGLFITLIFLLWIPSTPWIRCWGWM